MASKIPELVRRAREGENNLFGLIPYISGAIRVDYAMEYLESQGTEIALDYINEIMSSQEKTLRRTAAMIKKSPVFQQLIDELQESAARDHSNPKLNSGSWKGQVTTFSWMHYLQNLFMLGGR